MRDPQGLLFQFYNQAKADLFISIHINALPKGRVARGFQTYTLGSSKRTGKKTGVLQNLEVAKRENSVIFLEKDYKQTYQGYDPNSPESDIMFEFVQDKNMENSVELAKYMQKYVCQATGRQDMGAQQDNLAVLRLSSMPGALLELGFISTRDEEDFMNSASAESLYARGIFNAFLNYRKRHGGNITIPYMKIDDPMPEPVVEETKVEPVEVKSVAEPEPEPQPEVASQPEPAKTVKAEPAKTVKSTGDDAPVFKVQICRARQRQSLTMPDSRVLLMLTAIAMVECTSTPLVHQPITTRYIVCEKRLPRQFPRHLSSPLREVSV